MSYGQHAPGYVYVPGLFTGGFREAVMMLKEEVRLCVSVDLCVHTVSASIYVHSCFKRLFVERIQQIYFILY